MKNKYNLSLTQIDKIEKDIIELSSSVSYIDFCQHIMRMRYMKK
jgi:hypothetical protein